MLRRLFKGRAPLKHPDAEVRRSAVRALDDEAAENLAVDLARLVREDPDPQVRLACLVHVRDLALLESLVGDPHLGEAAAQRLRALAPGSDPPGPLRAAPAEGLQTLPPEQAAARIRDLQDVDQLVALALKTRGELRQIVLEHPLMQGASALAVLEKRSRDHDKTLNRHARTRLERCKTLTGEADALNRRAEELSAALARRTVSAQDRAWRERQHQLHHRLEETLDSYAAVRDELAAFGETPPDLEALRSRADALPPLDQPVPEAPAGPEAEAEPPAEDPFEALMAGFRKLDEALTSGRPFAEMAAERQALTDRWLTAADHRPPTDAQHRVFESVSHRFRELADAMEQLRGAKIPSLPTEPLTIGPPEDSASHRALWDAVQQRRALVKRLEQIRRTVRWPAWAPPTAEYAELIASAEAVTAELSRADEVLRAELEKLDELLAGLSAAIDEGSLNGARNLLTQARTLHDALPAHAVRSQGRELGKQAARLAELKDWQTFATSPKRQTLVEAMEALAETPLAPREQAERIKALRHEWQALGPVTQAADGRLADQFNSAADKAFEPCRAYFAEQARERKANLDERRRICDQLEQYLHDTDWSHADMKAAERIMRAARDEWRRFHPVDRNPGRHVEARFEELQGRLHDLVKAEWDRNLHAKEAIVAEAEALVEADLPLRDKVDAAKRLQRQWREVGITPRRPDQRLWRAFRAACDRVFSAREESRHAHDAALDELEGRLTGELDAFAARLEGDREARQASPADLRALRQATADIDRLPPARRRALAERRADLTARYSALLAEQERLQRRDRLLALKQWDEAMTAAELARARGAPASDPDPPADSNDLLDARLACAGREVPTQAARRLTVKAELAAGRESPAEDEPLRLEVQVERLQAGLTGGAATEDPYALAGAWCRLGPKDETLAPLRDRLFDALVSRC